MGGSRWSAALASLLLAGSAVLGGAGPSELAAAGQAFPAVRAGHARPAGQLNPGGFACQTRNVAYQCYGPKQIRVAYSIDSLIGSGTDGRGETIVIIDAFQNPTMNHDLAAFDKVFALPPPPSFTTIAPQGLTPFNPKNANQVGWSGEIALDVEWAHVVAPGAKIILALAKTNNDPDLFATEQYVVDHNLGDVISMSYSEAEACMAPSIIVAQHRLFETAVRKRITLVAGAGDWGSGQFACHGPGYIKAAGTPASDPVVTGVGGTTLFADVITGQYLSEKVWNEPSVPGAGGGGFSSVYARPSYQNNTATGSMRGVPDVAYDASSYHGQVVAWGSSGQHFEFWVFYGTSLGSPQWAAITALVDQTVGHRVGLINGALYDLGRGSQAVTVFHDITKGNNGFKSIVGFEATPGWDGASGWGSPIASQLVPALAALLH